MADHGFDGLVGYSWSEVESFCRQHFNYIPYWLPGLLHNLSRAYAVQSRQSTDPKCLAPYLLSTSNDTMDAVRANVHKGLEAFF